MTRQEDGFTLEHLPRTVPVFPLAGVVLLPRSHLPLNIFEPRYLEMVNDAIAGERIIGVIQPAHHIDPEIVDDPEQKPPLVATGCAGRITSFSETGEGTMLITLSGIARFSVGAELETEKPYRIHEICYHQYRDDLRQGLGEDAVDRDGLLRAFRAFLEANNLKADWDVVNNSANEPLVNVLSILAPYGPKEKQALLEAPDLKARSEILVSLTEMALAQSGPGPLTTLQ